MDLKLFDGHIRIAQLPKLQTNIVGALNEIEIQMAGLVSKDVVNEEARLAGPNAVLVGQIEQVLRCSELGYGTKRQTIALDVHMYRRPVVAEIGAIQFDREASTRVAVKYVELY